MATTGADDGKVEVLESGFVRPSAETPHAPLWISNLDLFAARNHTSGVYFYAPPSGGAAGEDNGFFAVPRLRDAFARALVPFYPLAGRYAVGPGGRREIDCSGEGALFVVARSDRLALDDFDKFEPSPETRRLFVPTVQSADPPCLLLLAQVTFLKCGGVALGTAMHHAAIDGPSACHFIQTWAAYCRGDNDAVPRPIIDRGLLRARLPPTPRFDHPEYSPDAFLPIETPPILTKIFPLSSEQIASLKSKSTDEGRMAYSTFCSAAAHLWKSMCIVQGHAPDQEVRLLFPVDIRRRLQPPLSDHYFGNAVIRVSAVAKANEIVTGSIGSIAARIKGVIDRVDDEYARSVIDCLELTMSSDYKLGPNKVRDTDVWLTSWLGMPHYDADFGWGNPKFNAVAQLHCSWFMFLTRNADREGGIILVAGLEEDCMLRFEKTFFGDIGGVSG